MLPGATSGSYFRLLPNEKWKVAELAERQRVSPRASCVCCSEPCPPDVEASQRISAGRFVSSREDPNAKRPGGSRWKRSSARIEEGRPQTRHQHWSCGCSEAPTGPMRQSWRRRLQKGLYKEESSVCAALASLVSLFLASRCSRLSQTLHTRMVDAAASSASSSSCR